MFVSFDCSEYSQFTYIHISMTSKIMLVQKVLSRCWAVGEQLYNMYHFVALRCVSSKGFLDAFEGFLYHHFRQFSSLIRSNSLRTLCVISTCAKNTIKIVRHRTLSCQHQRSSFFFLQFFFRMCFLAVRITRALFNVYFGLLF